MATAERINNNNKKIQDKKKIINEEMPKTQGDHNAEIEADVQSEFSLTLPSKQLFLNLHCPSTPASAWLIEDCGEKGKKRKRKNGL